MSLINRLKNGDLQLKWCYCEECQMEWLVPDIPDAVPEYCCHCTRPIDTTLEPADVLTDVKFSEATREGDVSFELDHRTIIGLDDQVQIRTYPIEEFQEYEDGQEIIACGHRLEILITKATSLSLDIPHETLMRFVGYLFRYIGCAGNELDTMMESPALKKFRRFKSLQDWSDDDAK